MKRLILFAALILLAGLACNMPVREATPPPSPPAAPETETTPTSPPPTRDAAPATLPPLAATATTPATETPATAPETPLPTFTPIAQPTLIPTLAPTATPTPRPAVTAPPRATNTPAVYPPLSFDYHISWRLSAEDPYMAIASVTITAQGGDGAYAYYRDGVEQPGPQFEYQWAACQGNPGTFRVTSGDGQSVSQNYFQTAPCPTPTPGP